MSLGLVISCVGEVIGAFGRRNGFEYWSDSVIDGLSGLAVVWSQR